MEEIVDIEKISGMLVKLNSIVGHIEVDDIAKNLINIKQPDNKVHHYSLVSYGSDAIYIKLSIVSSSGIEESTYSPFTRKLSTISEIEYLYAHDRNGILVDRILEFISEVAGVLSEKIDKYKKELSQLECVDLTEDE